MYFPFVHGAQNELLALNDAAVVVKSSGKIIPVIIPLAEEKNHTRLSKLLQRYKRSHQRFCMLVNPECCEPVASSASIREQLVSGVLSDVDAWVPVFTIHRDTAIALVQAFLSEYEGREVAFLHTDELEDGAEVRREIDGADVAYHFFEANSTGSVYHQSFPAETRVLVEDPFEKRKNADYPEDERYSDLYATYPRLGYVGFGDYQIVGRRMVSGFAPYAVALHLTYRPGTTSVRCRHFVSDRKETIQDVSGKFLEAVAKLVAWADTHRDLVRFSTAVPEYRQAHQMQAAMSPGKAKRLSIRHHIELMAMLMEGS